MPVVAASGGQPLALASGWVSTGWQSSRDTLAQCINCLGQHTHVRYIRDLEGSPLGSLVNAEFFVTHFIYFPAMQQLSGTGYFGGSNALWRTQARAASSQP